VSFNGWLQFNLECYYLNNLKGLLSRRGLSHGCLFDGKRENLIKINRIGAADETSFEFVLQSLSGDFKHIIGRWFKVDRKIAADLVKNVLQQRLLLFLCDLRLSVEKVEQDELKEVVHNH